VEGQVHRSRQVGKIDGAGRLKGVVAAGVVPGDAPGDIGPGGAGRVALPVVVGGVLEPQVGVFAAVALDVGEGEHLVLEVVQRQHLVGDEPVVGRLIGVVLIDIRIAVPLEAPVHPVRVAAHAVLREGPEVRPVLEVLCQNDLRVAAPAVGLFEIALVEARELVALVDARIVGTAELAEHALKDHFAVGDGLVDVVGPLGDAKRNALLASAAAAVGDRVVAEAVAPVGGKGAVAVGERESFDAHHFGLVLLAAVGDFGERQRRRAFRERVAAGEHLVARQIVLVELRQAVEERHRAGGAEAVALRDGAGKVAALPADLHAGRFVLEIGARLRHARAQPLHGHLGAVHLARLGDGDDVRAVAPAVVGLADVPGAQAEKLEAAAEHVHHAGVGGLAVGDRLADQPRPVRHEHRDALAGGVAEGVSGAGLEAAAGVDGETRDADQLRLILLAHVGQRDFLRRRQLGLLRQHRVAAAHILQLVEALVLAGAAGEAQLRAHAEVPARHRATERAFTEVNHVERSPRAVLKVKADVVGARDRAFDGDGRPGRLLARLGDGRRADVDRKLVGLPDLHGRFRLRILQRKVGVERAAGEVRLRDVERDRPRGAALSGRRKGDALRLSPADGRVRRAAGLRGEEHLHAHLAALRVLQRDRHRHEAVGRRGGPAGRSELHGRGACFEVIPPAAAVAADEAAPQHGGDQKQKEEA